MSKCVNPLSQLNTVGWSSQLAGDGGGSVAWPRPPWGRRRADRWTRRGTRPTWRPCRCQAPVPWTTGELTMISWGFPQKYGEFPKKCYPNSWMITDDSYYKNPLKHDLTWMMTGGTPMTQETSIWDFWGILQTIGNMRSVWSMGLFFGATDQTKLKNPWQWWLRNHPGMSCWWLGILKKTLRLQWPLKSLL